MPLINVLLLVAAGLAIGVARVPAQDSVHFAVIGDYGWGTKPEADVARLVRSWNPDFIITLGDNNYPKGEESTIDDHIGAYYAEYIGSYRGKYGKGSDTNRFWPSLGNHDLMTRNGQPYLDYFTLPGNERYYDFRIGPVHFFVLNSDSREPDGVKADSKQALWLKGVMGASTAPWQVVYMHHPPYSSGTHGSSTYMRWPFREWGADLVLSGHDHTYERLSVDGLTYIVNGIGGAVKYSFRNPQKSSETKFNDDHGAMIVDATASSIHLRAYTREGVLIDDYTLAK